ncbi:NAD-dependent epimerase/dehydratase family protein [Maribacter sp. X9]|uniref:NAD-dependent epimerase/dehydratase family protein n=1 Tax=Maribacter sp. X9 TaxID=3402159 RepID=UPI003AF340ED
MVLVTGGTGLVGSHLLLQLVLAKTNVRAIYRTPKKLEQVKKIFYYHSQDAQLLFDSIDWRQGDILDIPSLEEAYEGVTYVYHCAAFISFNPSDFKKLERVNREGTANIVNMSIAKGIQKLCYVSTIGTIGRAGALKMADEETEWSRQHANPYALTKYLAEMEVWRGAQEQLEVVIVNPGVILGPGYWENGSGTFFKTASKGYNYYPPGSSGFVTVTDVIKIMVQLMRSDIQGERYITVAENLTYKETLSRIATAMGKNPPEKELNISLLKVGRFIDWLQHKVTGKARTITKSTIYGLTHPTTFSSRKLKQALEFEFEPLDKTIERCAELFIEEISE